MFLKSFQPVTSREKNSPRSFRFTRLGICTVVPLGAAVLFSGCASQKSLLERDILESNLRQQERTMQGIQQDLDNSRATTASLAAENRSLRGIPFMPASQNAKAAIKQIEFGRGTGGVDEDRNNNDELLQVVVEPKDTDGHTVKAPGTLHLQAYEITPEGFKQPLSSWDVSAEDLRKSYKSGLFQSGHILVLPWKVIPTTDKLRLTAQLRLESGQAFEIEKEVKIRLAAGTQPRGSGVIPFFPNVHQTPIGEIPLSTHSAILPAPSAPGRSHPSTPPVSVVPPGATLPAPTPGSSGVSPSEGVVPKPIATTPSRVPAVAPTTLPPAYPSPSAKPAPAPEPVPAATPSAVGPSVNAPAPLAPGILSGTNSPSNQPLSAPLPSVGGGIPPLSTTSPEK